MPETLALKQQIFAEMDLLADAHVVLASSSSCIAPSHFTEGSEIRHCAGCLTPPGWCTAPSAWWRTRSGN